MTTIDTTALWVIVLTALVWGVAIGFKWGFSRGLFKGLNASRPNIRAPWNHQGKG